MKTATEVMMKMQAADRRMKLAAQAIAYTMAKHLDDDMERLDDAGLNFKAQPDWRKLPPREQQDTVKIRRPR